MVPAALDGGCSIRRRSLEQTLTSLGQVETVIFLG